MGRAADVGGRGGGCRGAGRRMPGGGTTDVGGRDGGCRVAGRRMSGGGRQGGFYMEIQQCNYNGGGEWLINFP